MDKPRLIYFDGPVSRGEECRLALVVAGVEFEDVRVKAADWPALKPTTPFGSRPVLEWPGKRPIAHSNAILGADPADCGLHPKDEYDAARHEGLMEYVEDLRAAVGPSMRLKDPAEKQRVREEHVAGYLPTWGRNVENQLGDGPFVAGAKLHVVDLKLHMAVRWFLGGKVDHIPPTIFAAFPKLMRVYEAALRRSTPPSISRRVDRRSIVETTARAQRTRSAIVASSFWTSTGLTRCRSKPALMLRSRSAC